MITNVPELSTPKKKEKKTQVVESPKNLRRSPWCSPVKDVPEVFKRNEAEMAKQLEMINWATVFPNSKGSYTVVVAGKPIKVIVQEDDVPLDQSSPKLPEHFVPEYADEAKKGEKQDNVMVPDSMDSKSLYSNDDFKTDMILGVRCLLMHPRN